MVFYCNELYHHGVKGQKWGVRRYQNPDGSLTDAGKKRYYSMSGEQLQKTLKRQVRSKRADKYGAINRWMSRTDIGEHSKKYLDEEQSAKKELKSSKEYKDWEKKLSRYEKDNEELLYEDMAKYDAGFNKILAQEPKLGNTSSYTKNGKSYTNDFMNKAGKLSVAYLQDLGYDLKTAEDFVDRMLSQNRSLESV